MDCFERQALDRLDGVVVGGSLGIIVLTSSWPSFWEACRKQSVACCFWLIRRPGTFCDYLSDFSLANSTDAL